MRDVLVRSIWTGITAPSLSRVSESESDEGESWRQIAAHLPEIYSVTAVPAA